MNRDEALGVLTKAGMSRQAVEMATGINNFLAQTCDSIRQDATWSSDYKRQRIAAAYLNTRAKVDEQLIKMAGGVARQEKTDAATVFGVRNLPGDPASLSVSRRDAGDRVSQIQDSEELRALLARAERNGDEVLARAIAERALELSDIDTMNDFLGTRPAFDDAAQRLWDQKTTGEEVTFMLGVQVHVDRPADLTGLQDWELQSLVTENEVGDSIGLASA